MHKIYKVLLSFSMLLSLSCNDSGKNHNLASLKQKQEKIISTNFKNFIEATWNSKNMDTLASISVENYTRHLNGIQVASNQSEMNTHMQVYFTGFPDAKVTIDDVVIKDNQLFTHWTLSGTNTGEFGEAAATGKKIQISGYCTVDFDADGKMVREDVFFNELELLQQLGYTLAPPILE